MAPRLNLPPLTRALFLIVMVLSTVNIALRFRSWSAALESRPSAGQIRSYLLSPEWAVPFLVLVQWKSLYYPWTFLTAAIVENNLVSLAVSALVIWFGGRYLERAWGDKEFLKFMLFVCMIPNLVTYGIYAVWYTLVGYPTFPTPIQGLVAVEAGFLVALKQLVPEHTVSLFKGSIRIRVKHFPSIFTFANILSGPIMGTDTAFWLSLLGFLTSWVYLRFFRRTEIESAAASGEVVVVQGDASDTFSFASFFPEMTHPVLVPVSNAIYDALVQLRLITPFSGEAVSAGNEGAALRSAEGLPGALENGRAPGSTGGRRAEAERRRALALKALDERLNAGTAGRAVARTSADMVQEENTRKSFESAAASAGNASTADDTKS